MFLLLCMDNISQKHIELFAMLFDELQTKLANLDNIVADAVLKNKVWLTMQEMENYLNCDKATIRRYINYQELPHYNTGTTYFNREEVDKWLLDKRIIKIDKNDTVSANKRVEEMMKK